MSKVHVDLLVGVALYGPRDGERRRWWVEDGLMQWYTKGVMRKATAERADEIGAMLVAENVASVRYRYREGLDALLPGPVVQYWREPYLWTQPAYRPTIAEAVKAIGCYDYQSCEHPGWESSEAKQFCEALEHALAIRIPGYDKAPWEWTSEEIERHRAEVFA